MADSHVCLHHREETLLRLLQQLSGIRLIQSEDREMVVELLPPKQAVGNMLGPDSSEILSSLSKPLRVTLTFASADKTSQSIASIQVSFCRILCAVIDVLV